MIESLLRSSLGEDVPECNGSGGYRFSEVPFQALSHTCPIHSLSSSIPIRLHRERQTAQAALAFWFRPVKVPVKPFISGGFFCSFSAEQLDIYYLVCDEVPLCGD